MTNKNIQMKKREGNDWDNLFPVTLTENVYNKDGINVETVLVNHKETIDHSLNDTIEHVGEELNKIVVEVNADMTTEEIQTLINEYETIKFLSGEYRLDFIKYQGDPDLSGHVGLMGICLDIPSNRTILMDEQTKLYAPYNDLDVYAILNLDTVENVEINGGVVVGDRENHTGHTGEHGMGVYIRGSKNIAIENLKAINCWGDGIYVGRSGYPKNEEDFKWLSEDIRLENIVCDNNRRQGISIVSVKNLEGLNWTLTRTRGTPPGAGLDIEPANRIETIEGVRIRDIYTADNELGITMNFGRLDGSDGRRRLVDVVIENFIDKGSDTNLSISNAGGHLDTQNSVYGKIVIKNPILINAENRAVSIGNWHLSDLNLRIENPLVVDSNTRGVNNNTTQGAYVIWNQEGLNTNRPIGNIDLINPDIIQTSSQAPVAPRAFVFNQRNASSLPFDKITIQNPKNNLGDSFIATFGGNVLIEDGFNVLENDLTENVNGGTFYSTTYRLSTYTSGSRTITLPDTIHPNSNLYTFENNAGNANYELILEIGADSYARPLSNSKSPVIRIPRGASLVLKRYHAFRWQVVSMVGDITVDPVE